MNFNHSGLLAALSLLAAAALPARAQGPNLIQDPSFEAATPGGYGYAQQMGPNTPWLAVGSDTSQGAVLSNNVGRARTGVNFVSAPFNQGVQQSVATKIGQGYILSFWNLFSSGPQFSSQDTVYVYFGGQAVFTKVLPDDNLYHQYSVPVIATTSQSLLRINYVFQAFGSGGVNDQLDDVSLTAVPEPSSDAAFAFTAFGVAGLMLRARKRKPVVTPSA